MMRDEEALLALDAAWNAAYPACDTAALDQILEIDQRYTRVYVKADGRWQAVATQVTPVRGDRE